MVVEEQGGAMQKKNALGGLWKVWEEKPGNENYKEAQKPYVQTCTMRIDDDEDDDDDELSRSTWKSLQQWDFSNKISSKLFILQAWSLEGGVFEVGERSDYYVIIFPYTINKTMYSLGVLSNKKNTKAIPYEELNLFLLEATTGKATEMPVGSLWQIFYLRQLYFN